MKMQNWLYVGIKVLAVYFAVIGAVSLAAAVVGLVLQVGVSTAVAIFGSHALVATHYTLFNLLEPLAYLGAAWFLGWNTKLVFRLLRVTWLNDLEPDSSPDTAD